MDVGNLLGTTGSQLLQEVILFALKLAHRARLRRRGGDGFESAQRSVTTAAIATDVTAVETSAACRSSSSSA